MGFSIGFTEAATQAIHEARLAAGHGRHGFVDSEHLLLGLIRSAPAILQGHCEPLELQEAVERLTPLEPVADAPAWPQLPITASLKKALELAMQEARESGSKVRPEHLVVALILEGKGTAALALREVGIDSRAAWESG